jgi:DEAD/DEAH box helicase domain-containing protein
MFDRLLAKLRTEDWFTSALAANRQQPARPGVHSDVPLRDDLREALQRSGIERLFQHQTEVLRLARQGRNVVVATPTASGKTLCFNLPVLERVLEAREQQQDAFALYLFPLKALEHDQLKSLHRLRDAIGLHEAFRAAVLDGDTKEAERKRLRQEPPDLLLTNPDMLHASILPGHERWGRFFSSLRFVVLDELHTYRGVFGSHVLHVLRRLLRVAAHYGSSPQVIAASATIRNPGELAEQLFALPFDTIAENGAPAGPRHVMLLDPPNHGLDFAASLFGRCVRAGVKTIVFCKSRRATELLYTWVLDRQPKLRGRVSAYRSGYLAEERRQIESELFGGRLQGVVSTSALEMGIDVGGLDAAILVGYPGSIMSTWQRGGRAGRGQSPAGLFLVAGHDALDQFYVTAPDAFFRAEPEAAVVDACNPGIRASHLLCAGAEVPLRTEESVYEDLDWPSARCALQRAGQLLQTVDGELWVPLQPRPHREVDIRQIGDTYSIHRQGNERRILGTIGGSRVFAECHEGAVYLHRGAHLEVTRLDLEHHRVTVTPADGTFFSVARSAKQTEILEVLDSRPLGSTRVHFGRVRITQRITGYEKRSTYDQKLLGTFELDLPPTIYETEGLWIDIDARLKQELESRGNHRMGSLHGIEHACIALSPLFTLCDPSDLGGITFTEHPQTRQGAVFVYDTYPGGIGLSARTFGILGDLLDAVRRRIERCDCDSGCPGCVHSPRCGSGNHPLDKSGTHAALRLLLELEPLPPAMSSGRSAPLPVPPPPSTPHVAQPRGLEPRVLYFDVETRYSALEVGGWHRIDQMGLALAVVYDEACERFVTFFEPQATELVDMLFGADLVVGFNLLRFDYTVLSAYTQRELGRLPTFDMLVRLHERLGFRPSLGMLATATLGSAKSADGLQSLAWVRAGRLDLVEEYCKRDVALTRDLFQRALRDGTLCIERRGLRLRTPPLDWELNRIVQDAARATAARVRSGRSPLLNPPPPGPAL